MIKNIQGSCYFHLMYAYNSYFASYFFMLQLAALANHRLWMFIHSLC